MSTTVRSRVLDVVTAFTLGAAVWLVIALFGLPQIFGIGNFSGLVPFSLIGAAFGFTGFKQLLVWPLAGLILLLLLIAYTPIIVGPARNLIRTDSLPSSADAVVALSAGVTADGFMPHQGSDRLRKALELVRQGVAPRIVITREKRDGGRARVTSALDQDAMISLAAVTEVISTDPVRSTRGEAVAVRKLATERGWTRVILVTSPLHSRRACATFEKAGVTLSCVPSDSRDVAVRSLDSSRDRVDAFALWLYEIAGTLRYRQLGWL